MISRAFTACLCLLIMFNTRAQFRYTTNAPVIRKDSIWSKVLNENRRLQFYKPEVFPEYADVVPPIVYVLDGDAYIHDVSTILNSLCERLVVLPPVNVVAVENSDTPGARRRDFEAAPPYASKTEKENNGATKFIRFLKEEVIPYAEKGYKKRPYRVVTSHSFSGWMALQLFLEYPDIFDGYILTDPSMNPDSV